MDFLPTLPVFAAYLAAVLVITFTPGPDMTLFLGKAVRQGTAAGIAAMLGASTGILIHTTLVALGLSALLAASATAFLDPESRGRALSAVAGDRRDPPRLGAEHRCGQRRASGEPLFRTWLTGLGVNLLNPKIIMFFVTFLPQFVTAGDPHAAQKLIFLGRRPRRVATPISRRMIVFGRAARRDC